MVDSETISRADIAWSVVFALWVVAGFAWREIKKERRKHKLRDIARVYAGKDIVTRAMAVCDADWLDYQKGVERQVSTIATRIKSETCGVVLISASDGSRPFAHLAGVPDLLCEVYTRAKRGEEDHRSCKVINALIRDSCREQGSPLATVTPPQWSQYERVLASIEELMEVMQLLAREHLLMPPPPPGEYFGVWRL